MEAQQLRVGFYHNACNVVESIVRDEVKRVSNKDEGIIIRMHFYDCFVRVTTNLFLFLI